jgi:hypothetical protein
MPEFAPSVFLNIPYDAEFERLYLAYVLGLTTLGFDVRITFDDSEATDRLGRIIGLIKKSDYSIHDLSRVQTSLSGEPRFNMPLELGLALYRSRTTKRHRVYIFEQEDYRIQRSTSDLNGIDPKIHDGTPERVLSQLRNIFLRESETSTLPQMIVAYGELELALPGIRRESGCKSLFEPAALRLIVVAANLLKSARLVDS